MSTKFHIKTFLQPKEVRSESLSIDIYGDFIGIIKDRKFIHTTLALSYLTKIKDFIDLEKFLFNSIGSFFVIASINDETRCYSSLVHHGFYFSHDDKENILYISEEESFLVSKESNIRSSTIKRIGKAHHGLARFPLSSLFEDIQRCPPGAYLCSSPDISVNNYLGQIYNNEKNDFISEGLSKDFFEENLMLIMKAYEEYFGELTLFMSGGIDSSLLLAIATKYDINVVCHYIPYSGLKDNNYKIAKFITSFFGKELTIVHQDKLSYEKRAKVLVERAISGPATLLKIRYRNWYLKDNIKPRICVTGQNLDSMYHIDTFAPNTEYTGLYRFLVIIKSSIHRFRYTRLNIFFLNIKRWVFRRSEIIAEPFERVLNSDEEHVKESKSVEVDKEYEDFKKIETFKLKEFLSFTKKDYLSVYDQNAYFKLIKFFRFVQNTYSNYFALRISERITRLNPYGEAPFLIGLMTYSLPISSIFKIKKFSHSLYKDISGTHHNKMIRKAVSYSVTKDLSRITKYFFPKSKEPEEDLENSFLGAIKDTYLDLKPYINMDHLNLSKEDKTYINRILKLASVDSDLSENECDEVIKVLGTLVYLTNCYKINT